MITIERTRESKHNTLETKVISHLYTVKFYCNDLTSFKKVFDEDIKKFPRPNTNIPELSYKCIFPQNKVAGEEELLEVWHLNSAGNYDRLIAKIIYKKNL